MAMITQDNLNKSLSYSGYIELLNALMAEGKTTGPNQSEMYVHYGKLNLQRMKRVYKTFEVTPELTEAIHLLNRRLTWVILAEGWCGDAAENVPAFAKIADAFPEKFEIKILLRDENLEVMNQYLTNGGRSIPRVIFLDVESGEEFHVWGPRPATAQQLYSDWKNHPEETFEAFHIRLHHWYTENKGAELTQELLEIFRAIAKKPIFA